MLLENNDTVMSREECGYILYFITWTMHFHTVNEIPTDAFNNYILLY
jgi:hypothetical protein